MSTVPEASYRAILGRISEAAAARPGPPVALLAVSKSKPAAAVAAMAALGQRAFGENYLQEALPKMEALQALALDWHFIGRLQSNKAAAVARHFDWVQSLDRPRLVDALASGRAAGQPPLNVLLQVNVDDEPGKGGCAPDALDALAAAVQACDRLRLRGLMAIPRPVAGGGGQASAFATMRGLFEELRGRHPQLDTLSMGMSADFALAIAEGATMVRIGTALFGPR